MNDPVFSTNIMGEGFALRPTTNQVYSPVNGEIVSIFETKHAIGILTKTGAEVLVHMGLDTVELKGEPFTVHVKVGQIVTPQTLLAEMDIAKVKAAGKETDIVVVMTNNEKMADYILNHKGESTPGLAIGEYKVRGH
ncbi:PTS glucose transporter subunit IIA [Enterococcus alcedinis]|uniref:PTS sugar transporter subunit IIA n=1 Tax=Enterococcus alcedinis TaxID=1274384 RepID=UPI00361E08BA